MADEEGELQPIIVKKIKKGGGHHGGAWKVAYADFVTAMMAFFLLLWLLNATTEEQKTAISHYFDPTHPQVSDSSSGAGGVLGGLSVAPDGAMVTNVQAITNPERSGLAVNNRSSKKQSGKEKGEYKGDAKQEAIESAKAMLREAEEKRMEAAKQALEKALNENPDLAELKENLIVDMTPEGLRIQVIDKEGNPMFASGSARMFGKTQKLLAQVGDIVQAEPNHISIRGHTDSTPYGSGAKYTNWELSADRANASRRVLLDNEFPAERVQDVVGKADTEHLFPEEPTRAGNRRISIVLLKEELTNPDYEEKAKAAAADDIKAIEAEEAAAAARNEDEDIDLPTSDFPSDPPPPTMPKIGTFKKTPGAVEFP